MIMKRLRKFYDRYEHAKCVQTRARATTSAVGERKGTKVEGTVSAQRKDSKVRRKMREKQILFRRLQFFQSDLTLLVEYCALVITERIR